MSQKELTEYLRAKYPCVYVITHEESRVLESVADTAKSLKRHAVAWSITKGVEALTTGAPASAESTKPSAGLAHMEKNLKEGVAVLKDFHPYLKDPVVVRQLRDTLESFRSGEKARTLVMMGPVQEIPVEIEKSVAVLEWTLPDREALKIIASNTESETPSMVDPAAEAALGLTEVEAENAFCRAIVRTGKLDPETIMLEKKQIVKKNGLLEFMETHESAATVGGLDGLKSWLKTRRKAFSAEAKAFGLRSPRGVVVVGFSGCGKSLVAKATGHDFGMPLVRMDVGRLMGGLVGSSEENMRKVLRTIEALAPCVVLLDEVDKGLAGAGSSGQTDGGTTSRVFGTFLTWMEERTADVFVVATANDITGLPPELTRKGRFDEIFWVDLPNAAERLEIFKIHLKKAGREKVTNLAEVVEKTEGYSGAEIEQIVTDGMYLAFDRGTELTEYHLQAAQSKVVPLSISSAEKLDKMRAWSVGKTVPASTAKEIEPVRKGRKPVN